MSGIKVTLGQKSAEITTEDVKQKASEAGKLCLKGLRKGAALLGKGLEKASAKLSELDTEPETSKTV